MFDEMEQEYTHTQGSNLTGAKKGDCVYNFKIISNEWFNWLRFRLLYDWIQESLVPKAQISYAQFNCYIFTNIFSSKIFGLWNSSVWHFHIHSSVKCVTQWPMLSFDTQIILKWFAHAFIAYNIRTYDRQTSADFLNESLLILIKIYCYLNVLMRRSLRFTLN